MPAQRLSRRAPRPTCPATRALSVVARSSGRKCTPAGADVALDHADDVAPAPAQGVAHPVDHHGDRRGVLSRISTRVRASRANPVGSAEPTTTTWSAAATASRVSWLRDSGRPRSASSSRLNPVSTTTSPTSAARSSTASSTPGRASTQRSGRGRPVSDLEPVGDAHVGSARTTSASREPELTRRAAASRPETSSSTPRCWATAPPCGSASISTLGLPRWACSAARPIASVVRPGAPAGPCTATTRPGAVPLSGARLGERIGVDDQLARAGRADRVRQSASSAGGDHGDHTDARERSSAAADRDAANVVAQQLHHRIRIESAELARTRRRRRPDRSRRSRAGRRGRRSA